MIVTGMPGTSSSSDIVTLLKIWLTHLQRPELEPGVKFQEWLAVKHEADTSFKAPPGALFFGGLSMRLPIFLMRRQDH